MTVPMNPQAAGAGPTPARQRLILNRAVQIIIQGVLYGVILFACAGTPRWWNAWAFVGLFVALTVANGIYLLPRNPEIVAERGRTHEGTRAFDRVILAGYLACYLGMLAIAGLDGGRWHWAVLGWPWAVAGGVLLALGMVPVATAMAVNRNLETTVRIQHDRGHQVTTSGPYRWVRHPTYLGMVVQVLAIALLLGSAWALVPALLCSVVMVVRTALEDRTLLRDLPGYAEYATTTRHRLLPAVW
jgi:protein-S-isoprenylcysteine O-methyltransferase Ste14